MKDAPSLLILLRSGAPAGACRALLEHFADATAALAAGPGAWRAAGIPPACDRLLLQPDLARLEADLAWLGLPGRHLLAWHGVDYPALLRDGAHPPAMLFVHGDPDLLWHPQVAVVGSRHPSAGGRDNARHFARALAEAGFAVTSGLAQGIDAAAHLGAMAAGRTVAVLGTGPDRCFPASNGRLMAQIAERGALVTEHPPGTAGLKQHFPSRNRLVAGLCLGTVVVEAAIRSGALITARLSAEAGREVFALPGSIHNPMARGCHRLIREGVGLVESAAEVIAALEPLALRLGAALRGRLATDATLAAPQGVLRLVPAEAPHAPPCTPAEQKLLRLLGHDPVNLDQLCERSGLTVGPLSAMLLAMELNGKISAAHGRYSRRS